MGVEGAYFRTAIQDQLVAALAFGDLDQTLKQCLADARALVGWGNYHILNMADLHSAVQPLGLDYQGGRSHDQVALHGHQGDDAPGISSPAGSPPPARSRGGRRGPGPSGSPVPGQPLAGYESSWLRAVGVRILTRAGIRRRIRGKIASRPGRHGQAEVLQAQLQGQAEGGATQGGPRYEGSAPGVPRSCPNVRDTGRGRPLPRRTAYAGRLPGWLVALSTPFDKRGWFHDEWHGGSWEWVRVTAKDCQRIAPAFLAEERRALGEWCYRQEYACSWEDVVDAVFAYLSHPHAPCYAVAHGGRVPPSLPGEGHGTLGR
jgi:hypothetical protein